MRILCYSAVNVFAQSCRYSSTHSWEVLSTIYWTNKGHRLQPSLTDPSEHIADVRRNYSLDEIDGDSWRDYTTSAKSERGRYDMFLFADRNFSIVQIRLWRWSFVEMQYPFKTMYKLLPFIVTTRPIFFREIVIHSELRRARDASHLLDIQVWIWWLHQNRKTT